MPALSQLQDIIYMHSVPHLCACEPPRPFKLPPRKGKHLQTKVDVKKAISYGLISLLWPVGFSLHGGRFCSFKHTIWVIYCCTIFTWHKSPVTFTRYGFVEWGNKH